MNIKDLHENLNGVSAIEVNANQQNSIKAIRILANEKLLEHISKVPALLVCVIGEAKYEDESGAAVELKSGDYVQILPMLKHWVSATLESHFLLIK